MLVRKEDLTEEMYEEANLLAFYDKDFKEYHPYQLVTIVKNRYTGIAGTVSLSHYNELRKEYEPEEDISKEPESLEEVFEEIGSIFNNFLGTVLDSGEEFIKEASEIKEDILGAINYAKTKVRIEQLKDIKDRAIKENVSTKGFIKKTDIKISILELSI